jgi:hypothetical protein
MNEAKCRALKDKLSAQPEPQIVAVEEFFDGNDDLGSIGCNLDQHPGVGTFRDVFAQLLRRSDVQAVYAQISELDPGKDCWPFSDTVLVVGSISAVDLQKAVRSLQPDEVAAAEAFGVSPAIGERHGSPVLAVWWD